MHLRLNLYIILFILLAAFYANAAPEYEFTSDQECTEKRLDLPPGVSSKIPVQDQDGTSLCSAYTAAQLIDGWRLINDQPLTELTSPISLGVQYASKTNKPKFADLPVTDMMDFSKNLDTCSYNVVRDDFNSKKSADFIYELISNFSKAKANTSEKGKSAQAILNCVLASGTKKTFDIAKIESYLDENHWVQFTNRIMEDLCQGHKKSLAFLPATQTLRAGNSGNQFTAMNAFRSRINERLSKSNSQPIGISYCRSVLKDKDSEGVSMKGELSKDTCKGAVHTSVIVGRRLLKYKYAGKTETICQFLVRDSYGSSCNGYDEFDPEALPSKSGGEMPKICEKGQVWVDENALLRNTNEVFHLKDK